MHGESLLEGWVSRKQPARGKERVPPQAPWFPLVRLVRRTSRRTTGKTKIEFATPPPQDYGNRETCTGAG